MNELTECNRAATAGGDDWLLVERIRAGDDTAFDALMVRYKRPVLGFVYRMTGVADEAEDIAQEVFVRAYRGLRKPAFRRTGVRFSSWLFQIARNAALDALRTRRRHPAESLTGLEAHGGALPDGGRSAAEETAAREIGERIAAAVTRLPADQRTALVLAEYEGHSYLDIAAIMKCSVKSVEARLRRARHALRRTLAPFLE